jgi:hypothetical protein
MLGVGFPVDCENRIEGARRESVITKVVFRQNLNEACILKVWFLKVQLPAAPAGSRLSLSQLQHNVSGLIRLRRVAMQMISTVGRGGLPCRNQESQAPGGVTYVILPPFTLGFKLNGGEIQPIGRSVE